MVTASFLYDPFGRRQGKTIGSATTNFLYDGVNPVQELVGGSVSANLLTGLGVDEYFNRTDALSSGYFLTDALGSTLALADATGALQTQYTYEPFGGTTTQGAWSANSFQYTGRENDGTGLYFYRARYYSPMYGRFVSEDPLEFSGGGTNFYAYVADDPTDLTDPSGRELVAGLVAAAGAVTGAVNEASKAAQCGSHGIQIAKAAARGVVAGAASGLAGLEAGFVTGNAFAAGAAAAAAYDVANDLLQGRSVNTGQLIGDAMLGAAVGGLGAGILPNGRGGWNFNPFTSPRIFGPKALQTYGQTAVGSLADLARGGAEHSMATGANCGCN